MKILHNPEDGAIISNLYYKDVFYFDSKEGKEFKPGMVLALDDEIADFFLELYGFLREVDVKKAEELLKQEKEQFKCERCDYKTHVKVAFLQHSKKHANDQTVEGLGILIVRSGSYSEKERDFQREIDSEAVNSGLEGEGLVDETPKKGAVMS